MVQEAAPEGVSPQPDNPELWSSFYRFQAAYLLLWSIVERYMALRFGPAPDPWERVKKLGEEPSFRAAVDAACAREGMVIDSRDPSTRYQLAADGMRAAEYSPRGSAHALES